MSRFIVEYNPQITKESRRLIGENVTASMESYDGTSHQYDIDMAIDQVINEKDIKLLEELRKDNVSYIEL